MKALVLKAANHLEYEEVAIPQLGPDEVLVRVHACGICGSDVHGLDGSTGRRIPPLIMGHEAAGVITEIGPAVRGWHAGDRVTFDSTIYCGECYYCRRGLVNLCDNRRVLGVSPGEYRQNGAFAEYVVVPQRILYRLPDELSFVHAAMLEPVSVAFHAVRRTPIVLDDTAVVVGAGMIGLLVIQALRLSGCGRIIAVDLDRGRLNLAQHFGADIGLKSDEIDVVAEVAGYTDGRGADVVLEVVGITPTVTLATQCVRKGGSLTLVGNLSPKVDLLLQAVVTRELTLYGTCALNGEYPACMDMIARGAVDVDTLISAIAPLSEGIDWFRRLQSGEPGLMKVILQP